MPPALKPPVPLVERRGVVMPPLCELARTGLGEGVLHVPVQGPLVLLERQDIIGVLNKTVTR